MHCKWTHKCWLAALFVGCSPSVVCCTEMFIGFDFFSTTFISWMIRTSEILPQKVRDKGTDLKRVFLNHPCQLATRILETTTTGVTRLTCNSAINFWNQSDCWSQWPSQCSQLWSQYLLVWIWISWKCIHHRMSVSNRWVLSLKNRFLLSICVTRTRTRLNRRFWPAFRLLKRRKMSEYI